MRDSCGLQGKRDRYGGPMDALRLNRNAGLLAVHEIKIVDRSPDSRPEDDMPSVRPLFTALKFGNFPLKKKIQK